MSNVLDIDKGYATFDNKRIGVMYNKKDNNVYFSFDDLCKIFNLKNNSTKKINKFISFETFILIIPTGPKQENINKWVTRVILKGVRDYQNKKIKEKNNDEMKEKIVSLQNEVSITKKEMERRNMDLRDVIKLERKIKKLKSKYD